MGIEKKAGNKITIFFIGIVIVLTIFVIMDTFFISTVTVKGNSMTPFVNCGDRLVVDIRSSAIENIQYKDIVIFESPEDPEQLFIKRVIAIEGQEFSISSGELIVDGENLCEDYIECDDYLFKNYSKVSGVVPENKVYLLGDNRNTSNDSRNFGFISTN